MNNTELQQVLDALSSNRVMAKDAAGNYTREVTPKRITDAIALCEASLARAVEPVVRYEPERLDYLDSLATYRGSFMGGIHTLEFTHEFDKPNGSFRAAIDAAKGTP